MQAEAKPLKSPQGGVLVEPLFALLFFCALGVFIGLLAHWIDHVRVWPWILVYVALGALGALTGGTLLPWILCGMAFGARTLMAVMMAMALSFVARWMAKR